MTFLSYPGVGAAGPAGIALALSLGTRRAVLRGMTVLATVAALTALAALMLSTPECMRVGRHAARAARGEGSGW